MNTSSTRTRSIRTSIIGASLAVLFSAVPLQAQQETAVESYKSGYQQAIGKLDASWDESSYNMPVYSSAYLKARGSSSTISSSLGIYSFKGNVKDAPGQRVADQRLKTFAQLLRKAVDEIAQVYEQQTFDGELKQLKPLLKFLDYTVSNKPLSLRTMDVDCKKLTTLKPSDFEKSTFRAEALAQVAEKLASTQLMATNKHLAYKFMTANMLMIPTFWAYLEPEFSRLVREAGASTDVVVFMKLHMNRLPYIIQDSRIWDKAPRFQASQLNVLAADAGNDTRHVKKVELSDTATKVTVRYTVGGREMWYRFDKSMVLVDNDTKELYPIQRIENQIPLGKTFIVVGCEGKAVEFTLVFPPIKKTLKQFVLDDRLAVPSSEKAKKRYLKKHGMMSDGSGRSPIVIYNLMEFTTTATPVQSTSNRPLLTDRSNIGSVENKRVVTNSKPDGRKEERTYRSDTLVCAKIFFPNGQPEFVYNYVNGVKEGDSFQYYETGPVRRQWTYKNGSVVDGVSYYDTGELKTKYTYKNGKAEGVSLEFYKNGTVRYEWNYVNGQLNGKTKEYREGGATAYWTYVSGELVSGIGYYPNGKQDELINFTNGERNGESYKYYVSGKIRSKLIYDNGKVVEEINYDENGNVIIPKKD